MTPVDFLVAIQPDGPWALGAITPDGGPKAWRTVNDTDGIEKFVGQYGAERNLYYQVNRVRDDLGSKRADKTDVRECVAVHVDLDPPRGEDLAKWQHSTRADIEVWRFKGVPRPSVVLFSGSGFQLIWLLDEPTEDVDRVEAINRELCRRLGGDSGTTDATRLLRLPGTLNYPGEKKREQYGRTGPVEADVVRCKPERTHSLDDFPRAKQTKGRDDDDRPIEPGTRVSEKELKRLVPKRTLRATIINGPLRGEDRSDAMWHVAKKLLKLEVPEDRIVAILTDPKYKISAHALAQDDPVRAASRAVTRQDHEDAPDAEGFGALYEQALEDVQRALGTEEDDDRYKEPLFVPIEQFMAQKASTTPWLIDGLIKRGKVAILGAAQKSTKTWFGTEIMLAVARGEPVCGEFDARRGRGAYFYAEDERDDIQARIRALASGHGFALSELTGRLLLCPRGKYIDLTRDEDMAWIVSSVRQFGAIDVLGIDPLRDVHSEKEDSSDGMAPVMKRLRVLSTLLKCAVVVPHHIKKNVDGGNTWSKLRGSSAMAASADHGIFFDVDEKIEEPRRTRITTHVSVDGRSKAAPPFTLTIDIHDDENNVAEHAEWSIERDEFVVDARREARREAIVESLRAAKVPLSGNAIIKRDGKTWVKGNKGDVLKEIRSMARDGTLRERGMKYDLPGGAS